MVHDNPAPGINQREWQQAGGAQTGY